MFWLMMLRACPAREAGSSVSTACFIAARTSGGRSVEVLMIRATTESKNDCIPLHFIRTFVLSPRDGPLVMNPRAEPLAGACRLELREAFPPPPPETPGLCPDRHYHG